MKKIFLSVLLIFLFLGLISLKFIPKNVFAQKKLTFWSIQLKPVYEKELLNIISEFEKTHPNYKVVWVDIPIQEAQKRTLASILSSTPPDLINLNPDFSVVLAQRNALHIFDEKDTEQFNSGLLNKLKYEGKIYALPFYATSPVTIYNKKILSQCGNKDFIKNYDELFKISKQLKECSNIAPFAAALNENDTLAKILNKYNISSFKTEVENEKTEKIFSKFNEMYKNGQLPKDVLTINHREVIEKYMSNQTLIIVAGSNFINMVKQNAIDTYSNSAISEQLTGENGKYDVSLMNLVIPKKSKNKDAAIDFALLLTNRENQLKLSKLTNVLPANKFTLEDAFFKNCSDDLVETSRCISAKQLNNLNEVEFSNKNKKLINETINKTFEQILLNSSSNKDSIKTNIQELNKTFQNSDN